MTVFADTSALYALLVASEAGHPEVAAAFAEILDRRRPLVTTNYVVLETAALLQRRIGLAAVRDLDPGRRRDCGRIFLRSTLTI